MEIFDALIRTLSVSGSRSDTYAFKGKPPTGDEVDQILEAARWAASAHNSQPWQFQVLRSYPHQEETARLFAGRTDDLGNRVWILTHLDRTRMLPVADPLGFETYLALGTACLNIQVASTALGLTCHIWGPSNQAQKAWRPRSFSFAEHLEPFILFEIGRAEDLATLRQSDPAVFFLDSYQSEPRHAISSPPTEKGMETFGCIRSRQSDRVPLQRGGSWSADSVQILISARLALDAHGVADANLILVEDAAKTIKLAELQERAWKRATGRWRQYWETRRWMRFNEEELRRHGDGELIEHFRLAGWKKTLARIGMRTPLAPLAISMGLDRFFLTKQRTTQTTTGAFLIAVLEDSAGHIESDEHYRRRMLTGAGAALQALWLAATSRGASLQFQSSMLLEKFAKEQIHKMIDIPDSHQLLLVIRLGYPDRDPQYVRIRRDPRDVIRHTA